MKKFSQLFVSSFFFVFLLYQTLWATTVEEEFKIEGIISIASIKALQSELLKQLDLKIIDLNLKKTDSGWPVLRVKYDPDIITKDKIETVIGEIEDPAGHKYKVHKGPLIANAALIDEENQAISILGDVAVAFKKLRIRQRTSILLSNEERECS